MEEYEDQELLLETYWKSVGAPNSNSSQESPHSNQYTKYDF